MINGLSLNTYSEFVIISRLYYESLWLEAEITQQLSSSHVEF